MPSTTPNLPPGSDHLLRRKANPRHEVILSVDLGKAQDYSCYTVVEAVPKTITNLAGRRLNIMELEVLNIRRLPLGTDYMDVSEHIRDVYRDPRLWLKPPGPGVPTAPTLIVDAGGVGDGVCDIIHTHMGIRPIRYKLVRGTSR